MFAHLFIWWWHLYLAEVGEETEYQVISLGMWFSCILRLYLM